MKSFLTCLVAVAGGAPTIRVSFIMTMSCVNDMPSTAALSAPSGGTTLPFLVSFIFPPTFLRRK